MMSQSTVISYSTRGKPQLTLDRFSYFKDFTAKSGAVTWRCVNKSCSSKLITNGENGEVDMMKSKFNHFHESRQTAWKSKTTSLEKTLDERERGSTSSERTLATEEELGVSSFEGTLTEEGELKIKTSNNMESGARRNFLCRNPFAADCFHRNILRNDKLDPLNRLMYKTPRKCIRKGLPKVNGIDRDTIRYKGENRDTMINLTNTKTTGYNRYNLGDISELFRKRLTQRNRAVLGQFGYISIL